MSKANLDQVLLNVSLAKYNTWRVGGLADEVYIPSSKEALISFINQSDNDKQINFIGLGSNILVRANGVRGVVIITNPGLDTIKIISENILEVGAGTPCAKVAKFAAKNSLVGAEFLVGIPGTMGGALTMNAGAFGGQTWDIVHSVDVINNSGETQALEAEKFSYGYRHVNGLEPNNWFISVRLKLQLDVKSFANKKVKELLNKRNQTQPIGQPSCGCVFKNPKGDFAARLIEESGLKGFTLGNSFVSSKHANFITHNGKGTAEEIENLIKHVEDTVGNKFNIQLEREVRILGEK